MFALQSVQHASSVVSANALNYTSGSGLHNNTSRKLLAAALPKPDCSWVTAIEKVFSPLVADVLAIPALGKWIMIVGAAILVIVAATAHGKKVLRFILATLAALIAFALLPNVVNVLPGPSC
jgi:hypothetical protein